jgi:citrate synthase
MLESEEAARRLGVKLSTLYAYVSRGLLVSHPNADSRRRLFDVEEVEQMARRSRGGRRVESRLASVTTGITQIREDGPYYRGHPVTELASMASFEEVADLLWQADAAPMDWTPVPLSRPPKLGTGDLLRWVTVLCGAKDRLGLTSARSSYSDRPDASSRPWSIPSPVRRPIQRYRGPTP